MEDPKEDGSKGRFWIVGVLCALPILYILSVGPAIKIYENSGKVGKEIVIAVYKPLEIATKQNRGFRRVMDLYLDFWR